MIFVSSETYSVSTLISGRSFSVSSDFLPGLEILLLTFLTDLDLDSFGRLFALIVRKDFFDLRLASFSWGN